ncbi:hypothetical protein [Asanoa siamensis]|uniref:WD40 repeat protein n=1 Tax=Asanoa siamensis TaxID=926357 RepID=A0ABQ4CWF4_9ACTN|nr:hypothetical protein [Asanoa siamensis]GIF75619.1 hypothetical protein Asi02nite_51370 [Asanoa siamensis]
MIPEHRVADLVRAAVDAIPVVQPPSAALKARAVGRRRPARTWSPVLVAAAVGATVLAAAVALPGRPATPGAGEPTYRLPRELAGVSSRTATVAQDPPGRSIALFTERGEQVVLATDGVTYRKLDAGGTALLSPDGLAVVVSDPARATGEADVVDLRTGRAQRYAAGAPVALRPLAWSPDGRRVAFATQAIATGSGPAGVGVLDLDTRGFAPVADPRSGTGDGVVRAVFTATGTEVVASAGAEYGCTLRVYGVDAPTPSVPLAVDGPVDGCREVVTLGLHALSTRPDPDSFVIEAIPPLLLAVGERHGIVERLSFRGDAYGTGALPEPITLGSGDRFLGWNGRTGVYIGQSGGVVEAPLDGRGVVRMTRFGDDPVTNFQLATALAPESTLADVEPGAWPWSPARTATIAALLLLAAAAAVVLRRRRRRT